MKRLLLIIITLGFLVNYCFANNVFFNQIDDLIIHSNGRTITCDQILCPESAVRCVVTKKSSMMDQMKVERINQCFDRMGRIIQEEKKIENYNGNNYPIDIYLENGENGFISRINGRSGDEIRNEIYKILEQQLPMFINKSIQKPSTVLRPVTN